MPLPATLSVVIPTYQRPVWIKRAIRSLAVQNRPPDEVVAVARDTDVPTHEAIDELRATSLPFSLRRELVSTPGFMPPVERGMAAAMGEVIAVVDDDAEVVEGWAERLLAHYAGDTVGAVGGRCINIYDDVPAQVPSVDRVGYVSPLGRFVGNMYCDTTFTAPVEVDFMLGGNMSVRQSVARRLEFDMELNRNVAQGYEVDLGLQIKAMGWKVLFDPLMAIRHYSAPRPTVGLRGAEADAEGVRWYSYNHARVALRRLPLMQRSVAFAYQLLVGERRAPGVLPLALSPLARRAGFEVNVAAEAFKGRWLAARGVLAQAR
jgi:GT2 family glycosyltransferase